MSQSDYLNFKKRAYILAGQNNLDNVLNSQTLTDFKTFQFGKEIVNTSISYNYMNEDDKTIYFGIKKNTSTCPDYMFCTNTHLRPHRVENANTYKDQYYRKTNSWKGMYLYDKKRDQLCVSKEMQPCDEFLYLRRHRNKMSSTDTNNDPNYVKHFSGDRL